MTRSFFLYFILKAFGLTLLPSYMISIFKSVILSGGTFFNASSHSLSISLYCFRLTFLLVKQDYQVQEKHKKHQQLNVQHGLFLQKPRPRLTVQSPELPLPRHSLFMHFFQSSVINPNRRFLFLFQYPELNYSVVVRALHLFGYFFHNPARIL